jgi:zinc/manganese transport system substrate-binding protein
MTVHARAKFGASIDGGRFAMFNKLPLIAAVAICGLAAPAFADPVKVVAAENFYGDLASQIGGANVVVTSILSNPDDDPHLFEASPETAKALTDARIVIVNGVDYDPWMEKLLGAHKAPGRKEILVGALTGHKAGDNPHLWYDPAAMKAAAKALVADLIAVDPTHKADYEQGEAKFLDSLKPLDDKIAAMRKSYAGQPVTASEPVFGYQAGLIGLKVRNEKYALAIMNNAEPTPSEVAAFENDLKGKKVKAMLYNAQASEPAVGKLVQLAKDNGIPVVGVSETEPPNSTYQDWMMGQLNALDKALAGGAS